MGNPITHCPDPPAWRARIERTIELDANGCHLWLARLDRWGYGQFRAVIDGTRRFTGAHRAAWLAIQGDIPGGPADYKRRLREAA